MSQAESTMSGLNKSILSCEKCPRLRTYCEKVAEEKKKAYLDEIYWGKPVPGFGDPAARLYLLGLAPAAHGANRTGRIFTGDQSGLWLYRALFKAGFSNQAESLSQGDGLRLKDAYVSCVVRCAPPGNKPEKDEYRNCAPYWQEEITLLPQVSVFVAFGKIAFEALSTHFLKTTRPVFKHGAVYSFAGTPTPENTGGTHHLIASYHPSQQNTFTKLLTEPMFDAIFSQAAEILQTDI